MSDEKNIGIIREFIKSMEERDLEKTLSLFTSDGSWTCPIGTFKGNTELKRFFSSGAVTDVKFNEYGNGIMIQGDRANIEYVISETIQGMQTEAPAFLALEFQDGKIQKTRLIFDRLLVAKQAAKWWQGRPLMNFIAKQTEKL